MFQFMLLIGLVLTTGRTDAGMFDLLKTPRSKLEHKKGTGANWFSWRVEGSDAYKNREFKFADGKILTKVTRLGLSGDGRDDYFGPWTSWGSYSFITKNTMIVFWKSAKVGREVELIFRDEFMYWHTTNTNTGKKAIWLTFVPPDY